MFFRREKKKRRKKPSAQFVTHKLLAQVLAKSRLEHFNRMYGFNYSRVTIRNQKTRWGSCSKKGTLSFNYRIALLPERVSDYIIVHELCHLEEFNHSPAFWALVAQTIPEYRELRAELRKKRILSA